MFYVILYAIELKKKIIHLHTINPTENYKVSFKTQKTYGELIFLSNEILFLIIKYFTVGEKYYEVTTILIDSLTGYNSALAYVFDRIL